MTDGREPRVKVGGFKGGKRSAGRPIPKTPEERLAAKEVTRLKSKERWARWRVAHPRIHHRTKKRINTEVLQEVLKAGGDLAALRPELWTTTAPESQGTPPSEIPVITRKNAYTAAAPPPDADVPAIRQLDDLTLDMERGLLAEVRAGGYPQTAARVRGINRKTLAAWQKQADAWPNSIYARLMEAIHNAEAQSEAELANLIRIAAEKRWVAAAWLLERRWPDRWSRRDSVSDVPKVVVNIGIKLPGLE